MELNSELHNPAEKEHAFRPQPALPGSAQWWYHGAIMDNGYTLCLEWFIISETNAWIMFIVTDPKGKTTFLRFPYDFANECKVSTETLDITMGNNRYWGKFPRYEMHFREGDIGADLVFDCLTQAVREPPDGVYIGRAMAPATAQYMSYIIRPRCRVTGKMTISGKEMTVSSQELYADHQWGNCSMMELFNLWYWGLLHLPKYTFVWWDGILNEKLGYQRAKWLWVWKGEKLSRYIKNADIYVESADIGIHEPTGITIPRKVNLFIDDRDIQGTATYTMKYIIRTPAQGVRPTPSFLRPPRYFRYLSDVKYDLNISGEKFKGGGQEIHELAI